MDNFGLVQAIEEPTRGKNTLDLVYTNEISMIIQVEVVKSNLSDHDSLPVKAKIRVTKIIKLTICQIIEHISF